MAHRLDEYLQAALISVEKGRVALEIRLTPGVAVLPAVLASVDTDGDGVISAAEQRAYAARVLRDLALTVDGERLPLRLVGMKFARIEEMKEGRGEIQFDVMGDVPAGNGNRRLVFENHHARALAAYLVNTLVPRDPAIRIAAQNRNYQQSWYQLDYEQAGGAAQVVAGWLGAVPLLLFARFTFLWWRGKAVHTVGARSQAM
jgi:hypothetical protein